jgi:hypothetical protein
MWTPKIYTINDEYLWNNLLGNLTKISYVVESGNLTNQESFISYS